MVARIAIATVLLAACSFEGGLGSSLPDSGVTRSQDAAIDSSTDDAADILDGTPLAACHSSFNDLVIGANKYRVLTGVVSHADAVTACEVDGGRLAIIEADNDNELSVLSTYLIDNGVNGGSECFLGGGSAQCAWIGLSQGAASAPDQAWTWIDGNTQVGFWGAGEPNDRNFSENGQEDCGELRASQNFPNINDIDCNQELPAICECHSL